LNNRRPALDLRVIFVPLGTPAGGRIKAFVMSDASLQRRVKAKLREKVASLACPTPSERINPPFYNELLRLEVAGFGLDDM
jgi:hypothetical protein